MESVLAKIELIFTDKKELILGPLQVRKNQEAIVKYFYSAQTQKVLESFEKYLIMHGFERIMVYLIIRKDTYGQTGFTFCINGQKYVYNPFIHDNFTEARYYQC